MARHLTTTATLPKEMQELYELTEPLEGGPIFDLPNYRQTGVDFSQLTVDMAENLIARDWPYLRRKAKPNEFVEAPAKASEPEPKKAPLPAEAQATAGDNPDENKTLAAAPATPVKAGGTKG